MGMQQNFLLRQSPPVMQQSPPVMQQSLPVMKQSPPGMQQVSPDSEASFHSFASVSHVSRVPSPTSACVLSPPTSAHVHSPTSAHIPSPLTSTGVSPTPTSTGVPPILATPIGGLHNAAGNTSSQGSRSRDANVSFGDVGSDMSPSKKARKYNGPARGRNKNVDPAFGNKHVKERWHKDDDFAIKKQWRSQMIRAYRTAISAAKQVWQKEKQIISWLPEPFFEELKQFWDDIKNNRRSKQASANRKTNSERNIHWWLKNYGRNTCCKGT